MSARETYGLRGVSGECNQATIELYAAGNGGPLGKYVHRRNAIDRIWNDVRPGTFMWNEWTEWMFERFCEEEFVTVTGPAASWKTTTAAMYALVRFYERPRDTVILCTSTTLPGLRRRIWKEISRFHRLRPAIGHPVQSQHCILYERGNEESGIFGLATEKGELERALGKIIGVHAPIVIVFVDEMPYTPDAIVEACVNLRSGAREFEFKGLGNAADQNDPHGRMSEPLEGWESITEESEEWRTRRGVCIHLDGLKSPNVVAGKILYPGLLNQGDMDNTIEVYGIDSPQFWQMRRGFWAPEGVQKTVLSMPMIVKGRAKERVNFDEGFTQGAGLDPSFEGGDRCVLRFAKCGRFEGKLVLQLGEIVFIKTKASADDPIHYQIVRQVKDECIKRNVVPSMFGLDSTGEGGGLHAIFQREWSPEVLGIEFGGRPSKDPVSQTNPKRCDQEYDRVVTELWFFFRLLVQNSQVRGLDEETATEFCRRWYEMLGPYISIETKKKMKERTRKSPDLADNAVVVAQVFKKRGGLKLSKIEWEGGVTTMWGDWQRARSFESEYESDIYERELEDAHPNIKTMRSIW